MQAVPKKLPPKGSQARTVYDHMLSGNTLTSMDAIELFKILRLPNRISELRHQYDVTIYDKTHQKGKSRWLEYSLSPFGE